jgi:tRNA(adenine34) deaminase
MHQKWMEIALNEAEIAFQKGEVPVGAVVVLENELIGRGHNLVETLQDATAHAEMMAISMAVNALSSWRLNGATMYVTLEPCPMCMGAIHLARFDSLAYGAEDPRLGACGSKVDLTKLDAMRNPIAITGGICAEQSTALLQNFFNHLRRK